jgi:hypothetical protein
MRAGDSTPACWACFIIFEDHVDVLAVVGAGERIDRSMSPDEARAFFGLRPVNLLSTACKFTAGADAVTLSELHAGHDDARPVQANPC